MTEISNQGDLLEQTTRIVSSYVSKNSVTIDDLKTLIAETYAALAAHRHGVTQQEERPKPVVSIRKSVTPDYLVCLEDGKKLKMLKRHLKTAYDMTPEEYRARWGLPSDYPMVAPNYARRRSALAREIGLGSRRQSNK